VLADGWPELARYNDLQPGPLGFSDASVFRVCVDDGDFCLRQWHAAMSQQRLLTIHRLLERVNHRGIRQVPIPIAAANGSTVIEVDSRLWQLEPWMPGQADFRDVSTDSRLESAMHVIARWHVAAASTNSFDHPHTTAHQTAPSPTVGDRTDLIHDYLSRLPEIKNSLRREPHERFREAGVRIAVQFRRMGQDIAGQLASVRSVDVAMQPCIRDLWHDHLLFTGEELTGLIDFGAVRTDTVACDLSRLLGSLFGNDSDGWRRALVAYESVRPLQDNEAALLQPLDRSGVLLSGMTWLKRRCLLKTDIPDIDRVSERLESIADRLTRM
jgi:Ser/Thr protein kinase RdoA (MazF antagonist)